MTVVSDGPRRALFVVTWLVSCLAAPVPLMAQADRSPAEEAPDPQPPTLALDYGLARVDAPAGDGNLHVFQSRVQLRF